MMQHLTYFVKNNELRSAHMNIPLNLNTENLPSRPLEKIRRAAIGQEPSELTEIYDEEVNIAVWQRTLSRGLKSIVNKLLEVHPGLELSINTEPKEIPKHLISALGDLKLDKAKSAVLIEDISNITNMFCCLFDLQRIGLRLTALDKAMCPKFHVDRIPARLITTYRGSSTEWLPHQHVDRRMLGRGSHGIADEVSGLYLLEEDIQQLNVGDVAILKGEYWEGNEQAGLVHRSPKVSENDRRLILTLDFMN